MTNGILFNNARSRCYLGVSLEVTIEYYCVYDKKDDNKDSSDLIKTTQYSQSSIARVSNIDHQNQ